MLKKNNLNQLDQLVIKKYKKNRIALCFQLIIILVIFIVLCVFVGSFHWRPFEGGQDPAQTQPAVTVRPAGEVQKAGADDLKAGGLLADVLGRKDSQSFITQAVSTVKMDAWAAIVQSREYDKKGEDQPKETTVLSTAQKQANQLGSIAQLVNKTHPLSSSYVPSDLVQLSLPSVRDTFLRKEAADALCALFAGAQKDGLSLICNSGYRDYAYQEAIREQYVDSQGQAETDLYSAKAGESEHQTGLAIDLSCDAFGGDLDTDFINTPEGQWIQKHAHEYGFIVRFPQDKTAFTGYAYEPWHIRYLGTALATDVYKSGLSYEEYLNQKK